jgi:hypothetical protein
MQPGPDRSPAPGRVVGLGLLAAGLVLLLFRPHPLDGDGWQRFEALDALLARGEVSAGPYSLLGPLGSAPQGQGRWQ